MNKKEVINILEEIGTLLELKGENPFKVRAYYNGARVLENLQEDLEEQVRNGALKNLKGIGDALSQKISLLVTSGSLPFYDELRDSLPVGLRDMLRLPGLGAKKIRSIHENLGISTIGELEYACRENRLRDLPGFGEKSQEKVLKSIELHKKYSERFLRPVAESEATMIIAYLRQNKKLYQVDIAGSLRREMETVKDLDIIGSCRKEDRNEIMGYFITYERSIRSVSEGITKSAIILESGMTAEIRLVAETEFPFLLHHATGSKAHNVRMRQLAKERNLKMNEYGLFRDDVPIPCSDETAIFEQLGLPYIAPALREDKGEIEAAGKEDLPDLYSGQPFFGVFHVHTTYSDGAHSLAEIVRTCQEMGHRYVGISDHSEAAFYANGLTAERLKEQHKEIDDLNQQMPNFKVFKGIEVDILGDGTLDFPDTVLSECDFVIASVHSQFQLPEDAMTRRICRALENPYVTMLGHPTGRLLLSRESYALNMETVIQTAARHGKMIEINASPYRLDLDWRWCKLAKAQGVMTSLNPDAHATSGLSDYNYGIGVARKGWMEARDILNTYPTEKVQDIFVRTRL